MSLDVELKSGRPVPAALGHLGVTPLPSLSLYISDAEYAGALFPAAFMNVAFDDGSVLGKRGPGSFRDDEFDLGADVVVSFHSATAG
jgi:hypothetical protein